MEGIRRKYEAYTWTPLEVDDNDTTYVTVCDISGRGILTEVAAEGDKSTTLRLTIDGGAPTVVPDMLNLKGAGAQTMQVFKGFASALKVEMKLGAAGAVTYRVSVLVE